MKKIPTIFERDWTGNKSMVTATPNPECDWVFRGEGVGTRKWDGTCCMVRGGKLFKRYDAKNGKAPPPEFEPCGDADPVTGHRPGWLPVGTGSDDRWFREAMNPILSDGTYELLGPKVQGNPERALLHRLERHGLMHAEPPERTFDGLKKYLSEHDIEGIVFHHPDGRMAKIKRRDFGLSRATAQPGQ